MVKIPQNVFLRENYSKRKIQKNVRNDSIVGSFSDQLEFYCRIKSLFFWRRYRNYYRGQNLKKNIIWSFFGTAQKFLHPTIVFLNNKNFILFTQKINLTGIIYILLWIAFSFNSNFNAEFSLVTFWWQTIFQIWVHFVGIFLLKCGCCAIIDVWSKNFSIKISNYYAKNYNFLL